MLITQIPSLYQLAVYKMLGSREMCDMWWKSSNYNFDFLTPLEQWEKDDRPVKAYIDRHFEGLLE